MNLQIKPQKGKAFDKLPAKTLAEFYDKKYLVSTKYDGNQIWIIKQNNRVSFFTSDWKEFYNSVIADDLVENCFGNFIVVAEYNHDCIGMLGDRPKSAILTTFRTNFKKKLPNSSWEEVKAYIKVFDFLVINKDTLITNEPYTNRLQIARATLYNSSFLEVVETLLLSGKAAIEHTKQLVKAGWEGTMLSDPDEIYHIGKRVNHCIKLKFRKTADLYCIGIEPGEGKYEDMIGSLILEDSSGRKVMVGSGLSDIDREVEPNYFIGQVIEIEYEQIMDTYIQPVFITMRLDKSKEEID